MLDRTTQPLSSAWTDERKERVRHLWEVEGLSAKQIAADLGVSSRSAILGLVNRNGWQRPQGPRVTAPRLSRAERLERDRREKKARSEAKATIRKPRERYVDGSLAPLFIVETPPSNEFLGLSLMDLAFGQCRFPRGGDNGEPFLFCGRPTVPDQSYCPSCYQRTHYCPKDFSEDHRAFLAANTRKRLRIGQNPLALEEPAS